MNEFVIIKKYFSKLAKKSKGAFNLTDDIFFDKKNKICFSTDTYNEGIHFLNFDNPDLVFKKIIRSSISDLICKGITPKYYFINFSGNKHHTMKKKMKKISKALKQEQNKYNIILSGGNISRGKNLSITISTIGISNIPPILWSGAKLNDDIYVTNTIGDAYIGLNVLKKKIKIGKKISNYFINRFYVPNLPYYFSKNIYRFANSSIDISDGLFQDLKHILVNSNMSSNIFLKKIPLSRKLKLYLNNNKKDLLKIISNGDDYQILFTASKKNRSLIKKISKKTSTKISMIGVIKDKNIYRDIKLVNENLNLPKKLGYIHNFN